MAIVPLGEVRNQLSKYVEESQEKPVVITKNGRPSALIIGVEHFTDDDIERMLFGYNRKFRLLVNKLIQESEEKGGIAEEEFWRQVGEENAVKLPAKKKVKRS